MAEEKIRFYVFRKDDKICAIKNLDDLSNDHPDLENVICLIIRATTPEEAISRAISLDNTILPIALQQPPETVDSGSTVFLGPDFSGIDEEGRVKI